VQCHPVPDKNITELSFIYHKWICVLTTYRGLFSVFSVCIWLRYWHSIKNVVHAPNILRPLGMNIQIRGQFIIMKRATQFDTSVCGAPVILCLLSIYLKFLSFTIKCHQCARFSDQKTLFKTSHVSVIIIQKTDMSSCARFSKSFTLFICSDFTLKTYYRGSSSKLNRVCYCNCIIFYSLCHPAPEK